MSWVWISEARTLLWEAWQGVESCVVSVGRSECCCYVLTCRHSFLSLFPLCIFLSFSLSVDLHVDLSLLLHISYPFSQSWCALAHSSNAFALAQDCHNVELHLSW